MIRYFYSVCLFLIGMGLPLLAKTTTPAKSAAPSYSSKTANKTAALPPTPAPKVKVQATEKQVAVKQSVPTPSDNEIPESLPEAQRPIGGSPILGKRLVAFPAPKSVTPAPKSMSSATFSGNRPEDAGRTMHGGRLARVTAYWAGEGDYYTGKCLSSTGVRLHDGHCAVDPNIIPYGSIVEIAGVGKYLAVDTGTAVINRTAAREGGHTSAQRNALVIDVFFENRRDGEKFAACESKFATVSWWTPRSADADARARSLFAEEDWSKIQSKQL